MDSGYVYFKMIQKNSLLFVKVATLSLRLLKRNCSCFKCQLIKINVLLKAATTVIQACRVAIKSEAVLIVEKCCLHACIMSDTLLPKDFWSTFSSIMERNQCWTTQSVISKTLFPFWAGSVMCLCLFFSWHSRHHFLNGSYYIAVRRNYCCTL